jgi:hypothetical protein
MAMLAFVLIASAGLITTRFLLKAVMQRGDYSNHIHALIFAFGLGITWFLSFLWPVAIANGYQLPYDLFEFIFLSSCVVWILAYLIDLLLTARLRKKV